MEVGPISWQCPKHENYHINSDCCIVEFVKNGEKVSSGEKGEIVVTGLFTFAMPFIRYKLGDVGVSTDEECSCGRGLPMMKSIEGRIVDSIVLPNGKIVSPYVLTCIIENISGINRYQIIQERNNLITLKYIKNENYSEETNDKIKIELQKILGKDIFINPIIVNELPKDKSGKFRVVKSLIT
jgi:phenylacetate-CoA ligase